MVHVVRRAPKSRARRVLETATALALWLSLICGLVFIALACIAGSYWLLQWMF